MMKKIVVNKGYSKVFPLSTHPSLSSYINISFILLEVSEAITCLDGIKYDNVGFEKLYI
jgi:hypothetical protein